MSKRSHYDSVLRLTRHALDLGAVRETALTVRWNIAGNCSNAYEAEYYGRPPAPHGSPSGTSIVVKPFKENHPVRLVIHTRCRKCSNCLWNRQRRWYGAALAELAVSQRTWFGTLTLSPENQFRMALMAQKRTADRAVNYHSLTPAEQFVERHNAIGVELTKYLKRIRKNSGARLRYLLVAEKHKSGDPHYHMLVHEQPGGGKVLHRHLSEAWNLGFENWRLSDPLKPKSAAYLCKYLSKSAEARVRASLRYGATSSGQQSQFLSALIGALENSGGSKRSVGGGGEAGGAAPSSGREIDPHYWDNQFSE